MTPSFTFNTTIRPGLLVAVKTSIKGNVTYKKTAAEVKRLEDGGEIAEWDTERSIKNAKEQETATKVIGKARNLIKGVCSTTDFGYLCPLVAKPELEQAIIEARKGCDAFNATSTVTKIRFNAVTGTIAQDDYQAVRALRREVTELLTDMQEGFAALDVATVREAAVRAKQLGQMLTPDAQVRLEMTIKTVRENANKISKAGDTGAKEIDSATIRALTECRTAFLDIDQPEGEIGKPMVAGRGIDLDPSVKEASDSYVADQKAQRQRVLDM